MKNTFLDLMAVLKLDMLSSFGQWKGDALCFLAMQSSLASY